MIEPHRLSQDLWTIDGPVVRWFLPFPTRMTIARLAGGGLFVHSPIALTADVRRAVEALGKRADLRFDGELGDRPEPAWAPVIDQLVFRGSRALDEVVFFHRLSRTVVFGDLVENFDPRTLSRLHRCVARFGGVLAPNGGTPLDYRLSFLRHRALAREAWRRIEAWAPQRVVMCHGMVVEREAMAFLESAFAWVGQGGGSGDGGVAG